MPPLKNKHWKKPKYVKLYESKGSTYAYYRRVGLQFRIEGDPGTAAWFANYERIHSDFEKGQAKEGPQPGSVDAAIMSYKESDRFRALKPATKETYGYTFKRLSAILGPLPLASITRRAAVVLRDKIAQDKPRSAIEAIKVLSLIFQCAMDNGEVDKNPIEGIKKPVGYKAKQHAAWTDEQINQFLEGAKPVWRRAVTVALFTGLRRGDLIRLSRGHIKDGWLTIDIAKTDGQTSIPIHSALAEELDREMPAASLLLIPTLRGRQMRGDSLTHGVQKEWKRLGVANGPPLHGLRRSAIIRLLEAGCSVEEVQSITDQTEQMVKYYAAQQHRKALAKGAILKLEKREKNKSV